MILIMQGFWTIYTSKESGAWLQALPFSSLGQRLDDSTLRIAVGLRLGTTICAVHQCRNCSEEVDCQGIYGLSCCYSEGIHHWHRIVISITYRALTSAKIPSRLESVGLSRSNDRGLMAGLPFLGLMARCSSGMPPALTLLWILIEVQQQHQQGKLQQLWRIGRSANMPT